MWQIAVKLYEMARKEVMSARLDFDGDRNW